MKHGKLPARHDPRTLRFADYLYPSLPAPESSADFATKIEKWPMYDNDRIEDCTCAAAGHLIQDWTANVGQPVTPALDPIVQAYRDISGYNPEHPSTDKGANVLDVLNYWRKHGIADHKILAYASIEPGNQTQVKDAVELLGGAYIGLQLPKSAENQTVWSVPPGGPTGKGAQGSWEGHVVPIVAYDSRTLTIVTWGQLRRMTWQFWGAYCDEAYAIVSPDFRQPPQGIDLARLQSDLAKVIG